MKHSLIVIAAALLFVSFVHAQSPALALDGSTAYVGGYGDILDMGLSDWSFQIWFKTTDPTGGIMGKTAYGSVPGRWGVFFSEGSPNILRVLVQGTSSIIQLDALPQQPGNVNWNDGIWHNVTVTCVRNGNLTIYMDGVYNNSTSMAALSANNLNSTGQFFIGAYGNSTGSGPQANFYLNGTLDEARVWNKALNATEVAANYNVEIPYPQANLVGYWRMNEDSGTSLLDLSGNNYTGTIYGTATWTDGPQTLPVELSSFTAVLTADFFVKLHWVTQSETGVSGFYVYRGTSASLDDAILISPMIDATNTTSLQEYEYTDSELFEPGTYYYWLMVQDMDGGVAYHGPTTAYFDNSGNSGIPGIPVRTGFSSVYPNPFNPRTTISYGITKAGDVNFKIYNQKGQLVKTYNEAQKAIGYWKLDWDGTDFNGRACPTGVYYVKMHTGNQDYLTKAVLLK